jgi:hypothetical protein
MAYLGQYQRNPLLPGFLTTSVKASMLQFGFVASVGLLTGLLEEVCQVAISLLLGGRC